MGMRFDSPDVQKEFQSAFGREIGTLTAPQLLWLAKFAKHTRLRCRSNAALYGYFGRIFPNARFRDIPKEYKGKQYKGMEITVNSVTGAAETVEDTSDGEE